MAINGNTIFLIFVILYIIFSSPGGNGVTSQYEYNQMESMIDQLNNEYGSFQNMSYNTNFRNITGFKLSYNDVRNNPLINATYPLDSKNYDQWYNNDKYLIMSDEVRDMISDNVWNMSADANGKANLFPPIITGSLLGNIKLDTNNKYKKVRMPMANFYDPPRDFSDNFPLPGESYNDAWEDLGEVHNVTFPKGKLTIQLSHIDKVSTSLMSKTKKFYNSQEKEWKLLSVRLDFMDKDEVEKHSVDTLGVYDIKNGRILAMSESGKFHSLFAFPHYLGIGINKSKKESVFEQSKKLINEYWNTSNYIDTLTMGDIGEQYNNAVEKCEFMIFLQLDPWNQYTKDQMKMIDDELKWPLGRPANLSSLPPINVRSGLVYSPDCGVSLTTSNVKGERYELKIRSVRFNLFAGMLLIATQIYLLLRQMQHTNTPSSVNKISYYTFFMINAVDGIIMILYLIFSSVVRELYLSLIISAFMTFILAVVFETRYLVSVYASQVNEQGVGIITLLRGRNTLDDNAAERPVVIPDEASISSSLHGRLSFILIVMTFILISSTSWPRHPRTVFEYTFVFLANSYWIPQVFRNAVKGIPSRRERMRGENARGPRQNKAPLLWKFIIGTTIIRVLPIVYFFTNSTNVFRHHKDKRFVVILCLWLLFQLAVLYSQDILGSRWFLAQNTIPEGYSYYKQVSLALLKEHGDVQESEDVASEQVPEDHHTHMQTSVDCAICMSEVPVNVEELPETHNIDIHSYMVTPCDHIFHSTCLQNWMNYKLQCPVCRAPLPPS